VGMYVSQLSAVPIGTYQYYVYLVEPSPHGRHSESIAKLFQTFAATSDIDAVIVRGPQDLSQQLHEFLVKHATSDFTSIEQLFLKVSCLIVSEGSLQVTRNQIYVIPVPEQDVEGSNHGEYLDYLLGPLLEAMRAGSVSEFCRALGAKELSLSDIKGGMLVATMRRLNEVLQLKPNFQGIGLNINAIIERALGPAERSMP